MPLLFALLACGDGDPPNPPGAGGVPTDACIDDRDQFAADVSPALQSDCIACHVAGGLAGETRNVLLPASDPGHLEANFATLLPLALEPSGATTTLLAKIAGDLAHGGGVRLAETDVGFGGFAEFAARAQDPGGCEPPAGLIVCGDDPVPGAAPLRRLTETQIANAMEDLVGIRPVDGLLPQTLAGDLYSTWPEANVVSSVGAEGILYAAEDVAGRLILDTVAWTGCDAGDASCLGSWGDDLAMRAFRRPLTAAEQAVIDGVRATDPAPDEGLRRVVELVFQTPQFLYLDATSTPVTGLDGVEQLDGYALASRLSFFLLDTTPSAELLALAASGGLDSREAVLATARALVDDPRALPVVAQFHYDWLHVYQLETIAKDEGLYPQFGPELVAEMKAELDLFTTEVVWMEDGTFDALIGSNVTWTTPALDDLYGTNGSRVGDDWERRVLPPERAGVLTRTAFLTAHSYSATSAPVRRGAYVLDQMLCEELVPPPGVSLELPEPTESNTIRDRLAAHRADPACAGCHDRIDPVGFSFENFAALGEWRDLWENGIPVDATGSLEDPTGSFDGAVELVEVLDQGRDLRDCYSEQWLAYGLGRAPTYDDVCTVGAVADRFDATGGDLRDLLAQVAASDAMRYRPTPLLEDP